VSDFGLENNRLMWGIRIYPFFIRFSLYSHLSFHLEQAKETTCVLSKTHNISKCPDGDLPVLYIVLQAKESTCPFKDP
jgi:hypothetical protein